MFTHATTVAGYGRMFVELKMSSVSGRRKTVKRKVKRERNESETSGVERMTEATRMRYQFNSNEQADVPLAGARSAGPSRHHRPVGSSGLPINGFLNGEKLIVGKLLRSAVGGRSKWSAGAATF